MNILITGTAGFIGYHLSKRLLDEGHTIIGIDQINDYYDVKLKLSRLLNNGIEKPNNNKAVFSNVYEKYIFYKCDLENRGEIFSIFKKHKIDAICHLAAQAGVRYSLENPMAYINSNIIGFQNIIDAVKENQIRNFCYASSSSVYGGIKEQPFSEKMSVDYPISLYAATKKSNELIAFNYSHLFGIKSTGLRFFTVYGPWGRPDMALFKFTKALFENKSIDVYNYGKMVRDFTYIDDIIEGIVRVIKNPAKNSSSNPSNAPYQIYNIGNNNPVSLMDFIGAIENEVGKKFKINLIEIQPGDVASTYADVSNLKTNLGYKPDTTVEKGIKSFMDWYKEYYEIDI
jgi:UDP-glucuronate 4-epimerase